MAEAGYQWAMTAPAVPFTRRDFTRFPPGPGPKLTEHLIPRARG